MKLRILFQHKFSLLLFILATLFFCVLTFVTLWATAGVEEGMGDNNFALKFLAKAYYVFRFPTHTFFFDIMNGPIFLIGLFINCSFYGFLFERILSILRPKKF